MIVSDLERPLLTQAQWDLLAAFAKTLTPRQATWVSGYFASLDHAAKAAAETERAASEGLISPIVPRTDGGTRRVTVLYASETGNSATLAEGIAQQGRAKGLDVSAVDVANYRLRGLKDEQDVLIVTSTCGEGGPPQPAAEFFDFVEGRKAPRLAGLRYAVLALGDSTYERFCEAGKRLDRRFEELGATRLHERVDCDVDFEEAAAAWTDAVLGGLVRARAAAPATVASSLPSLPAAVTRYDKRNPFRAEIIENLVLTGRGSSKETRHVELALADSGVTFEPGDALGVVSRNDPRLVERLLGGLSLDPASPVTLRSGTVTLAEALEGSFEITVAAPRFLQHWAELTGADALKRLASPEQAADRAAFLREHHVLDITRLFPVRGLDGQTFVAGLRPLQPRLYSIASSLAQAPDEVHLTIGTVRYHLHDLERAGVASGYMADRGAIGERLPVFVQSNPHFRLPADDVPILMIGAGTGVAPFRAFMQEREAREAQGRAWLVFGERNFRTDFLYQTEWQRLLAEGTLSRLDVAFSRDRAGKTYVQDRLREHAADVFRWLDDGAHLYVCGDAARLAPDVHEALIDIVEAQSSVGRDEAGQYLRDLQRDGRYQRDVY